MLAPAFFGHYRSCTASCQNRASMQLCVQPQLVSVNCDVYVADVIKLFVNFRMQGTWRQLVVFRFISLMNNGNSCPPALVSEKVLDEKLICKDMLSLAYGAARKNGADDYHCHCCLAAYRIQAKFISV